MADPRSRSCEYPFHVCQTANEYWIGREMASSTWHFYYQTQAEAFNGFRGILPVDHYVKHLRLPGGSLWIDRSYSAQVYGLGSITTSRTCFKLCLLMAVKSALNISVLLMV